VSLTYLKKKQNRGKPLKKNQQAQTRGPRLEALRARDFPFKGLGTLLGSFSTLFLIYFG